MDQLAYEKGSKISFDKSLSEGNKRVSLKKVKRSYLEASLGEEVTSRLLGNKKYGYVLVDNETGVEGNARGDIQGLLEYYYKYNGLTSPMQEYGNFLERMTATNRQNQNFGRGLQ